MNVYKVKVEIEGNRGGPDWLQVTRPSERQAREAVRAIVMPGVRITQVVLMEAA